MRMPKFRYAIALMLFASTMATCAVGDEPTLPGLEDEYANITKEQVLKNPEWRKTMQALNVWLTNQKLYSKDRVKDFKYDIIAQVDKMSPRQMIEFKNELDAKLAVLNGADARAVRMWMREQLSLASEEYGDKLKAKLPDITRMSANDLQDYLNKFTAKVGAEEKGSEARQVARTQQAKFVQSELNRQTTERDQAMAAANASSGASSGVVGSKNVTGGEAPWGYGGYGGGGYGGYGGWGYRW
jgi:hypothetical protein